MKLTEIFNASAIAANYTEAASNKQPYLGGGFFPAQKKNGLDLKWIIGYKGLPVTLMPSNFDAKSTMRDRIGIGVNETEMAFFRESMMISEKDEQEIARVRDANDPYAAEVLDRIFDDSQTLIDGADVVPERMIMQLLAPIGGEMGIAINANNVDYTYNYDKDGHWKENHYCKIAGTDDVWTASETCDPMKDLEDAMDAQENESGTRPEILLMSKPTFNLIKNSAKVRSGILAQNVTANVNYTTARVKSYVEEELGVSLVIYTKRYKNEAGEAKAFYPDNIVMMLPNGAIGKTWYGTTPEERTLSQKSGADVSIVNTGVAVAVTITENPVNTITTVSEIVLPSFERMEECCALEVA